MPWKDITVSDEFRSMSPVDRSALKQRFFETKMLPRMRGDNLQNEEIDSLYQRFMETPDDTGEGLIRSALGSAARGFLDPLAAAPEVAGAYLGIEGLEEFGGDVRGAIEGAFPVNPAEQGLVTDVAGVLGQVGQIVATGGGGSFVGGKLIGKGATELAKKQAEKFGARAAVQTAMGSSAVAGGLERAEQLGLEGGDRLLRGAIAGGTELLAERLGGFATELGGLGKAVGFADTVESGFMKPIIRGIGTEAGEEGLAEAAGQVTDIAMAPEAAPGMDLKNIGYAMLLGGVGGAAFGGIEAAITPRTKKAFDGTTDFIPSSTPPPGMTAEEAEEQDLLRYGNAGEIIGYVLPQAPVTAETIEAELPVEIAPAVAPLAQNVAAAPEASATAAALQRIVLGDTESGLTDAGMADVKANLLTGMPMRGGSVIDLQGQATLEQQQPTETNVPLTQETLQQEQSRGQELQEPRTLPILPAEPTAQAPEAAVGADAAELEQQKATLPVDGEGAMLQGGDVRQEETQQVSAAADVPTESLPAGQLTPRGVGVAERDLMKPYANISVPDLEKVSAADWGRRRDYLAGKQRVNQQERANLLKTPKANWENREYNESARINEVAASLRAAIQDMQLARPDLESEFKAKEFAQTESGKDAGTISRAKSKAGTPTADDGRAAGKLQRESKDVQSVSDESRTATTTGKPSSKGDSEIQPVGNVVDVPLLDASPDVVLESWNQSVSPPNYLSQTGVISIRDTGTQEPQFSTTKTVAGTRQKTGTFRDYIIRKQGWLAGRYLKAGKRPSKIYAEAVDSNKIELPQGYTLNEAGDLYVFNATPPPQAQPQPATPATQETQPEAAASTEVTATQESTAAQPAAEETGDAGVAISPTGETDQSSETPSALSKLQSYISTLSPKVQQLWTPERLAAAKAFYNTGNRALLDIMPRSLRNRVYENNVTESGKDAYEAEQKRQFALRNPPAATDSQFLEDYNAYVNSLSDGTLQQERESREEAPDETPRYKKILRSADGSIRRTGVKSTPARAARNSYIGVIPGVENTWLGTIEDFDTEFPDGYPFDSKNTTPPADTEALVAEDGRAFIFLDRVQVLEGDAERAEQHGTSPGVEAIKRLLRHESFIHRGYMALPGPLKNRFADFVASGIIPPEDLNYLVNNGYPHYKGWRDSKSTEMLAAEEWLAQRVERMGRIPQSGPIASIMDWLRDVWRWLTGGETTDLDKVRNTMRAMHKALGALDPKQRIVMELPDMDVLRRSAKQVPKFDSTTASDAVERMIRFKRPFQMEELTKIYNKYKPKGTADALRLYQENWGKGDEEWDLSYRFESPIDASMHEAIMYALETEAVSISRIEKIAMFDIATSQPFEVKPGSELRYSKVQRPDPILNQPSRLRGNVPEITKPNAQRRAIYETVEGFEGAVEVIPQQYFPMGSKEKGNEFSATDALLSWSKDLLKPYAEDIGGLVEFLAILRSDERLQNELKLGPRSGAVVMPFLAQEAANRAEALGSRDMRNAFLMEYDALASAGGQNLWAFKAASLHPDFATNRYTAMMDKTEEQNFATTVDKKINKSRTIQDVVSNLPEAGEIAADNVSDGLADEEMIRLSVLELGVLAQDDAELRDLLEELIATTLDLGEMSGTPERASIAARRVKREFASEEEKAVVFEQLKKRQTEILKAIQDKLKAKKDAVVKEKTPTDTAKQIIERVLNKAKQTEKKPRKVNPVQELYRDALKSDFSDEVFIEKARAIGIDEDTAYELKSAIDSEKGNVKPKERKEKTPDDSAQRIIDRIVAKVERKDKKETEPDLIDELYRLDLKSPMNEADFVKRAVALGVDRDIALELKNAIDLQLTANALESALGTLGSDIESNIKKANEQANKFQKRADALIDNIVNRMADPPLARDRKAKAVDPLQKAYRDQLKKPVSREEFIASLEKINVFDQTASLLFDAAEMERSSREAIAAARKLPKLPIETAKEIINKITTAAAKVPAKKKQPDAVRSLYRKHLKKPMSEAEFSAEAKAAGLDAATTKGLYDAINLEIVAIEIQAQAKAAERAQTKELKKAEREAEKYQNQAEAKINEVADALADPSLTQDKEKVVNPLTEIYQNQIKTPITEPQFVEQVVALGVDEETATLLFSIAAMDRQARIDIRVAREDLRRREMSEAQASRLIYAQEEELRQGSKDREPSKSGDSINKAFREQVVNPLSQEKFRERLDKLKVSQKLADRLYATAERVATDNERAEVYRKRVALLDVDSAALTRFVNDLRLKGKLTGEPIQWRDLLSLPVAHQDTVKAELLARVKRHEALRNLSTGEQQAIADALNTIWQRERRKVFQAMIKKADLMGVSKEDQEVIVEAMPALLKYINQGMLGTSAFYRAVGEKFGIAPISVEARKQVEEMAAKMQEKELYSFERAVLAEKILKILQNNTQLSRAEILSSFWVTSVLSGGRTIFDMALGVLNGGFSIAKKMITATIETRSPKAAIEGLTAFGQGIWMGAQVAAKNLVRPEEGLLASRNPAVADYFDDGARGAGLTTGDKLLLHKGDKPKDKLRRGLGVWMSFFERLFSGLDHITSTATTMGTIQMAAAINPKLYNAALTPTKQDYANALERAKLRLPDGSNAAQIRLAQSIIEDGQHILERGLDESFMSQWRQLVADSRAEGNTASYQEEPTGAGGLLYSMVRNITSGLEDKTKGYRDEARVALAEARKTGRGVATSAVNYFVASLGYLLGTQAQNLLGVRFMRFTGNKLNELISFIPVLGMARLQEKGMVSGEEYTLRGQNVRANQVLGWMSAVIYFSLLKGLDEEDDEERGWIVNGSWENLTPERKSQLMSDGFKPNTVAFFDKDTGRWTSYNFVSWPFAGWMAAFGSVSDYKRLTPDKWNEKILIDKTMAAAYAGAFAITDISSLSSLTEMFGRSTYTTDPAEGFQKRVVKGTANYLGGFFPKTLKDVDAWFDETNYKPEETWEHFAKEVPFYRRNTGAPLRDIFYEPVQVSRTPWSRALQVSPDDPAYKALGRLNSRGIWLTPANPENRKVKRGGKLRDMTDEESNAYMAEVGKRYKEFVMKQGDRLLEMDVDRADELVSKYTARIREIAFKRAIATAGKAAIPSPE